MGIWQPAKVNPSQLCYREELIESSKNKGVDIISNIEKPEAVDGWMMRKHSRVDGYCSLTVFPKVFHTVRDQYQ